MKTENKTSRRQWFAGLLRGGLLAGFGATAYLLGRRSNGSADCIDPQGYTGCRACLELNGCQLPRALSVKQFLDGDRNHDERTA